MKKSLKIIIVILIIIVGIIILDTVQALVFNHSPLIKFRENYDGESIDYKDYGILVITYSCIDNSQKTVFRWNEYNCPATTNDEDSNKIEYSAYIRTFNVLNVADSNDENYLWITIRQYQEEEVASIKVKRELCPNITANKNYEFTIMPFNQSDGTIISVFNNSTIISIEETDLLGVDQIQQTGI